VHLQYTDATRADIITSLASMEAQEVVRWQKELDKIKVLKLIVDNALAEAVVAVGINYFQIKEATLKRHNAAFLTELTEQGWQKVIISALVASVYCKCTSCGVVPHPYQLTRKDLIQ
jgi:hypothetical protein